MVYSFSGNFESNFCICFSPRFPFFLVDKAHAFANARAQTNTMITIQSMLSVIPLYPTQASRQFVAFSSVVNYAGATDSMHRTVLRAGAIDVIMRTRHIMIRLFRPCFWGSSTTWQPCRSRFPTSSFLAHDRFQTLSLPSQWLLGGKQFRCLPRYSSATC